MRRYLFSTDHRIVGLQFFWLALTAAFAGVGLSLLMRFHLISPAASIPLLDRIWPVSAAGGVMTPELYLSLMTIHGTLMVFFVLSVAPQSAFGYCMLPSADRCAKYGLPSTECAFVLVDSSRFRRPAERVLCAGGRSSFRVDRLSSAECCGRDRRTGAGHGTNALDPEHRRVLHRFDPGCCQFHRHGDGEATGQAWDSCRCPSPAGTGW